MSSKSSNGCDVPASSSVAAYDSTFALRKFFFYLAVQVVNALSVYVQLTASSYPVLQTSCLF